MTKMRRYLLAMALMVASTVVAYAQEPVPADSSATVVEADLLQQIDLNPTDLFEQYNLGRAYMEGQNGLEKDASKGLYWMEKSAAEGLADAQLLAGISRYIGNGCEPDTVQAMKWLHAAAAQNNSQAAYYLGTICANQEPADWFSAVKWFGKAAELGHRNAETWLAICSINGNGTEVDYEKAAALLLDAVQEDIPDAYFYLGMLYRHGAGVKKDEAKGLELLRKAAEMGQEDAKKYTE